MTKKPGNFTETILELAKILKDTQYAIRGTASLILQGYDMNVDDIDILCDKETALKCNDLLKNQLIKKVKYKKSEKFRSYFGKFKVNGIQVEIMGEWEIKQRSSKLAEQWTKPFNASKDEVRNIKVKSKKVKVTKVETELKVFASMGRWNAFHKIKKQLQDNIQSKQQRLL
jgi:hypothetical protein